MRQTQKQMILQHLLSGVPITEGQSFIHYGVSNLPCRVSELIRDGYGITKRWLEVKTKFGVKRVREYSMKP